MVLSLRCYVVVCLVFALLLSADALSFQKHNHASKPSRTSLHSHPKSAHHRASLKKENLHTASDLEKLETVTQQGLDQVHQMKAQLKQVKSALSKENLSKFESVLEGMETHLNKMKGSSNDHQRAQITQWLNKQLPSLNEMDQAVVAAKRSIQHQHKEKKDVHSTPHQQQVHHQKSTSHQHHDKKAASHQQAHNQKPVSHAKVHQKHAPTQQHKAVPSTPDLKKGDDMVSQGRTLVDHAVSVLDKTHVMSSAKEELKNNVAHMKTDLEMMETTSNQEALNDLMQALRMRSEKVNNIELRSTDILPTKSKKMNKHAHKATVQHKQTKHTTHQK